MTSEYRQNSGSANSGTTPGRFFDSPMKAKSSSALNLFSSNPSTTTTTTTTLSPSASSPTPHSSHPSQNGFHQSPLSTIDQHTPASLPPPPSAFSSPPSSPLESLLSHLCSLEIQNLKIKKILNTLDLKLLKDRVRSLESENKALVERLKTECPDIVIHSRPPYSSPTERGGNGFISIDFTSDNGLEYECFGLSEIPTFPEFQIENERIQFTSPPRHLSTPERTLKNPLIEQKMFRNYSVGSSRLSLANRFSLEWGDEARQHLRSQSVDGILPRQHNLEVALSSMRLSTLEPLLEMEVKKNFLEFCIIGVKRSILCGKQLPTFGPCQRAEILDNFPHQHHPFIDSMADFAFPAGVGLLMTDSKIYAEHLRSQKCDQYNVFQFSDSYGTLTYACCLIVNETIPLNPLKSAKTIKALKYLEHLERCGHVILRFMKRAHRRSRNLERKVILNKKGDVVGYLMVKKSDPSHASLHSSNTAKPSPLKERFLNRKPVNKSASVAEVSSSNSSKSSASLNDSNPPHKLNELLGSKISKFKEDVKNRMKKGQEVPRNGGAELPGGVANLRPKSASYLSQAKKTAPAKAEWQYVVTQRAYCILSAQPQHALLFQILEEIALRERELMCAIGSIEPGMSSYVSENAKKRMGRMLPPVDETEEEKKKSSAVVESTPKPNGSSVSGNTSSTSSSATRSVDLGVGWESFTEEQRIIRNGFLEYVQCHQLGSKPRKRKPRLLATQRREPTPSPKPASFITFSYPKYINRDIVVPAPCDMVTIEMWSVAAIVSVLNPATIISLLNILILEKSLIVQGQNVSMVTAITSAIAGLLVPFRWQGVFIPLVPANAMEILQAPVPFIVGTCMAYRREDVSPTAAILDLDKVLQSCGQQELWSERSLVELPEVSVMMPIDNILRGTLSNATKLLTSRLPEDKSNLQLATFLVDMTDEEKLAIKEVRHVIEHHNVLFCGDLIVGDGWKKYGAYDSSTGEFEFYPQWFLDHQRSILEFQDEVVHTQLFVSYVDNLRVEYLQKHSQREFISIWIAFRYHLRKQRRAMEPPPPVVMRRISK